MRISVPAIITNFIMFAVVVNNLIFAGLLDDPIMLAVQGLSNTVCSIVILSVMIGLNAA